MIRHDALHHYNSWSPRSNYSRCIKSIYRCAELAADLLDPLGPPGLLLGRHVRSGERGLRDFWPPLILCNLFWKLYIYEKGGGGGGEGVEGEGVGWGLRIMHHKYSWCHEYSWCIMRIHDEHWLLLMHYKFSRGVIMLAIGNLEKPGKNSTINMFANFKPFLW